MSALHVIRASLAANARAALTGPSGGPPGRRVYVIIGAVAGIANLMINIIQTGSAVTSADLACMTLALILLMATPLRPIPGVAVYLLLWLVMLALPDAHVTDMMMTKAAFFIFLGRFLRFWTGLAITLVSLLTLLLKIAILAAPIDGVHTFLFFVLMALAFFPTGVLLRTAEAARLADSQRAAARLEDMRLEIAREMHDLVAYSMSQTALRAQRAAADASYPPEVREEFMALESTASDALHELRLLLRTLRQTEPALGRSIETSTGLGHAVTDLGEAIRVISDDIAAAGFEVTYRCLGEARPSRLQATTLSRVAREMSANIIRHGDPASPVTVTLSLGPEVIRLVTTNGVGSAVPRLPRSGVGVLGMRERLAAIDGTLTTLAEDNAWITTATIPLPTPRTHPTPLEKTA